MMTEETPKGIPTVSPALTYILLGVAALSIFDSFALRMGAKKKSPGEEPAPAPRPAPGQHADAGESTLTGEGKKEGDMKGAENSPPVSKPEI
ncbi:MAG TPA: hypothetical protein GXX51_04075 [Firmicutes bacterium]|nr:hypothetical protein [Bacillota bacterium]